MLLLAKGHRFLDDIIIEMLLNKIPVWEFLTDLIIKYFTFLEGSPHGQIYDYDPLLVLIGALYKPGVIVYCYCINRKQDLELWR